jgi:predicted RNA binding protein YcfA (HicA-like mRNA interferase family)
MKRTDLMRLLKRNGWWVARDKGPHTVMTNGKDIEPVPRQRVIDEGLCKAIIRRRGLR